MQLEQLDVVLRRRSQWEAMELGTALVRRHAAAIWKPWLLLTLPLLVLLNLGGWWLDNFWLPALVMWWLKPALERIPLYVISRAAFGAEPSTRQTLHAQLRWGWQVLPAYLSWRRFGPARALLMPVDLLEGGNAEHRRARRRVVSGSAYGHASLLGWVCWHFEAMLQVASIALVFMFVPLDALPETLRAAVSLIGTDTPAWAWFGFNLLAWAAMTLIGPFYSGAGFGLYLNRRTQLEAWDVEIAFRRMRQRLAHAVPVLLLLLACMPLALPAHAQDHAATATGQQANRKDGAAASANTPARLFGTQPAADTAGFRQAAARAYEDPRLGATRHVERWQRKPRPAADKRGNRDFPGAQIIRSIGKLLAQVGESLLWVLLGLLVLVLAFTARRWLPWLRGSARRRPASPSPLQQHALPLPQALPTDILASARRLWQQDKPRHALALLYQASIEELGRRTQRELPPGSTEAQCLRASRQLPLEAERTLFARMVRTWQYAAYAGRLPSSDEFEALLAALHLQYRWPA